MSVDEDGIEWATHPLSEDRYAVLGQLGPFMAREDVDSAEDDGLESAMSRLRPQLLEMAGYPKENT